jgi:hypothetical protein
MASFPLCFSPGSYTIVLSRNTAMTMDAVHNPVIVSLMPASPPPLVSKRCLPRLPVNDKGLFEINIKVSLRTDIISPPSRNQ